MEEQQYRITGIIGDRELAIRLGKKDLMSNPE